MKQVLLVLIVGMLCCGILGAQNTSLDIAVEAKEHTRHKWAFKYSPSALISTTLPRILFSVEHPLGKNTKHFYAEHELAYVYADFRDELQFKTSGLAIETRLRMYLLPLDDKDFHFYISGLARYTFGYGKGYKIFNRAGAAYQELLKTERLKHFTELVGELGAVAFFDKKKRFLVDVFGGIGFCHFTETYKNLPIDATDPIEARLNNGFNLNVVVVLKFGWMIY